MMEDYRVPYEALLDEIRNEFNDFKIVHKRTDRLSHRIDRLLCWVTLGGPREYLTRYHTVLGNTLYVPDGWDSTPYLDRIITLRHERVHLRQRRRYGGIGMAFLYLIPFFPLGLAYGRARIEWEAYAETVLATAELKGVETARSASMREYVVRQFTSGAYGWMWPFRRQVDAWYDEVLAKLDRQVSRR
ncbi:MAG TPA: hypothetical protein PLV85_04540 [Polyangiaceae bacterium]|nr:hypothetical protein [Polyangiaceae bacterium]